VTGSGAEASLRWAEVDVGALQHNVEQIGALLVPSTALMAMVKSNGYGHGLQLAAEGALLGGASWLGVYHAGEAAALRAAGVQTPILVVGATSAAEKAWLVGAEVDVTVIDPDELPVVASAARSAGRRARAHLKVDTGLNRLGARPERWGDLRTMAGAHRADVAVRGVFTHFADADAPDLAFAEEQHRRFLQAAALLRDVAPDALLHCAGSAAILRMPHTHHDLVRLGIAMYGYAPPCTEPPPLRVAMTVLARVVQVKTVDPGDTVGYGRTWRAVRPARIATVALGYGQGLRRSLSNGGNVLIGGARCPIAGIVSMDQIGVDVSHVDGVVPGDEAAVFGERDGARLGADELADLSGTIPHEILCAVPADLPRVAVR